MSKLKIAGVVNDSIVDGPGLRYTLFLQGCPHHCKGCHNPQTHDFEGGKEVESQDLFDEIKTNPLLSGITLSGGDPLCQAEALIPLVKSVKEIGLEVAVYTGFVFEDLIQDKVPFALELLKYTDILIDGRFELSLKSLELKFKGSSNQRTIDVQKSLKLGVAVISTDPRWI